MIRHRYLTAISYLRGLIFCLYAKLWCQKFSTKSIPRCYGWPSLRSAGGTLTLGQNVVFGSIKIIIAQDGCLSIGNCSRVNDGSVLGVLKEIKIGNDTGIAENVMIRDHDHNYKDVAIGEPLSGYITDAVSIGNGCWIGYGVAITKGVSIMDGAIVGAAAVVTKSVGRGEVVVGVPARCVNKRQEKINA